jgi:hypothetical protein
MTVCGEKVTGVCVAGKCPHFKRCCPVVWDKYGKIEPNTNEEWFCSLTTEEKARFFASNKMLNFDYQMWIEWLKEKHDGNT